MRIFFNNGYGISIVRNDQFMSQTDDLYEIAVLSGSEDNYELLHDQVHRNLTDEMVEKAVKSIRGEGVC